MIALLLVGCWMETRTESHCEVVERDIADDEPLELGYNGSSVFSVNEALGLIEPRSIDARDLLGTTVPIEVTLARGEGTATLHDSTQVDEVVQAGGPIQSQTWVGENDCLDELRVPVVVTLIGEGVSVAAVATLENDPIDFETPLFHAHGSLDPETDTVPVGLHGAPVSGEIAVTWFDGRIIHLGVTTTTSDGARESVLWFDGGPL